MVKCVSFAGKKPEKEWGGVVGGGRNYITTKTSSNGRDLKRLRNSGGKEERASNGRRGLKKMSTRGLLPIFFLSYLGERGTLSAYPFRQATVRGFHDFKHIGRRKELRNEILAGERGRGGDYKVLSKGRIFFWIVFTGARRITSSWDGGVLMKGEAFFVCVSYAGETRLG